MGGAILREHIQIFIRQFGLLEQDHTPCHVPLSPSQAHALQVIGQEKNTTQYQLATHLHLEKSTVSRLVQSLVERGWVERNANPENRREVQLSLTASGQDILEVILKKSATKYQDIWNRIPEGQQDQIVEALTLLNSLLQEEHES